MSKPSDDFKLRKSFFHTLNKVNTEASQLIYESLYKSSHNILSSEIWTDTVPEAPDKSIADLNVINNSSIIKKYNQYPLTMIDGSNGQAWYINDGGVFVRPFIDPVDVPISNTNLPSDGYRALMYRQDNTIITPSEASWYVDYYSGIILFEENQTPNDLSLGVPKITAYAYIGNTGVFNISTDNIITAIIDFQNNSIENGSDFDQIVTIITDNNGDIITI